MTCHVPRLTPPRYTLHVPRYHVPRLTFHVQPERARGRSTLHVFSCTDSCFIHTHMAGKRCLNMQRKLARAPRTFVRSPGRAGHRVDSKGVDHDRSSRPRALGRGSAGNAEGSIGIGFEVDRIPKTPAQVRSVPLCRLPWSWKFPLHARAFFDREAVEHDVVLSILVNIHGLVPVCFATSWLGDSIRSTYARPSADDGGAAVRS